MSKLETPMTRWYWEQIGGTLVLEFQAVPPTDDQGQRLIDGVVILGGDKKEAHWSEVDIEGKDIVVIQTKVGRLGMYLMGQAVFSAELMKRFNPRSIRSVALCERNDATLGPLLDAYPDVEVVIYPGDQEAEG